MATLFDTTTLNQMTLSNRIVRSATWEGMCDPTGRPTDKLITCYRDLALGGVGLLISGYSFITPDGKQAPGQMGIHRDDFGDDYHKLTKVVHEAGGKIAIQLVHAGGQTKRKYIGKNPVAPSSCRVDQFPEIPDELSWGEIQTIISAFGESARRAKLWNFDAVQLHSAHGYLLNQFLSPLTNRRTDAYGGSLKNRCRFLLEVYHNIRENVGDDYPVLIKLNASDNIKGGLTHADGLYVTHQLDMVGIDAIEVSAGTPVSGAKVPIRKKILTPQSEAYNLQSAIRIKKAVNCQVMVVGGFRSYERADKAIKNNAMDYIAMARPLIREPNLVNRWLRGDHTRAKCISCNRCIIPAYKEGGISCVVEKKKNNS